MGAGLAGLAAGYELTKKNIKVTILERNDAVGGLARTIRVKGFSFDTGPHRWYAKSNMVNEWMLKLLGSEVMQVPRLTRIYFDGKFFYYPIRLLNALSGIGLIKAFMAVFDYVIARVKARLVRHKLVTMEDGYINQFGKTLYETFFKRYSEKLWGVDCQKISVDWVGQRTRGLNIFTVIRDTFIKSRNVVSLVDEFSYPKRGVGRIAEKLAEEIVRRGGKIILNSRVTKVKSLEGRVLSVSAKISGRDQSIDGTHFISSIPISDLVSSITPSVSKSIRDKAAKLSYRDELQVALFIKKTHITPDTWIYVHPKSIPFMRLMEMDNWSDKLSPKGTTTLVFEIACNEGDIMWKKSDKDVVKLVTKSFVDEFQLIDKNDVVGGYVHRMLKEYPVYHVGYRDDVDEIKKYLIHFPNLQLIGRNGTFRYNNMDHSIEMGLYAAWNIIAGKSAYDIDSVNIEREYLEEKNIENVEDELVEDISH